MAVSQPNTRTRTQPLRDRRELIEWAIREIRELDELCRSQVANYGPLTSEDMANLQALHQIAES